MCGYDASSAMQNRMFGRSAECVVVAKQAGKAISKQTANKAIRMVRSRVLGAEIEDQNLLQHNVGEVQGKGSRAYQEELPANDANGRG